MIAKRDSTICVESVVNGINEICFGEAHERVLLSGISYVTFMLLACQEVLDVTRNSGAEISA